MAELYCKVHQVIIKTRKALNKCRPFTLLHRQVNFDTLGQSLFVCFVEKCYHLRSGKSILILSIHQGEVYLAFKGAESTVRGLLHVTPKTQP